MEWSAFVEGFLDSRRDAGASRHTLAAYAADLSAFATWYAEAAGRPPEIAALAALDVTEYRAAVARTHKPATTNRRVGTIKTALTWAVEVRALPANPIVQVRQVPELPTGPRTVDRRILGALLREAQREGSMRDVAIITLLAQAGRRIAEALRWADVSVRERSGSVVVRHGKGNKWREVPLTLTARQALITWRSIR